MPGYINVDKQSMADGQGRLKPGLQPEVERAPRPGEFSLALGEQ